MTIELQDLVLAQGAFRLTASIMFAKAEITALIGPSGQGKSTLLAAISGFLPPVSGVILIDGLTMAGVHPGQRPVSLVFQDHNLFPHLDVGQNVGLGLRPDLKLNAREHAAIDDALARVGLGDFGNRLPGSLSGGQIGRVALARALLRDKPILLLDEPFAALGPALRHEMLDLVAEVQREKHLTVLMVTHLPDDARRIAANSSVIAGGTVSAPVDTARLLDNPPKALRDYLG